MKNSLDENAEIYGEVYAELINDVLPAYHKAIDTLLKKDYPEVGQFTINSLAGINATILMDAINNTAIETGMPKAKARKKVLKQLHELTNLFVKRLDERDNEQNQTIDE